MFSIEGPESGITTHASGDGVVGNPSRRQVLDLVHIVPGQIRRPTLVRPRLRAALVDILPKVGLPFLLENLPNPL